MEERVILVDDQDVEIGTAEKLRAHIDGRRHRAFSVFVFRAPLSLLMQRRATSKYHSGGLWSNTCCGHPRPGESILQAAHRRLREELGFDCALHATSALSYTARLGALTECEYDHLLVGWFRGRPKPNPDEVGAWRWMSLPHLYRDVQERPERFTAWFPPALSQLMAHGSWRGVGIERLLPAVIESQQKRGGLHAVLESDLHRHS